MEQVSVNTFANARARLTIKYHPANNRRDRDRRVLCMLHDAPPIASAEIDMIDEILGQVGARKLLSS